MTKENTVVEQADRASVAALIEAIRDTEDPGEDLAFQYAHSILPIIGRIRTQAVEAERARVVAWLRHNPHGLSKDPVKHRLAEQIERGDHLSGDGGRG